MRVSAIRGVARPDRAFIMMDFVTMPPSAATSKNWASSCPAAAQPEAVSTGFGNANRPRLAAMSTVLVVFATGFADRTVSVEVIGSPLPPAARPASMQPTVAWASLLGAKALRTRRLEWIPHRRIARDRRERP